MEKKMCPLLALVPLKLELTWEETTDSKLPFCVEDKCAWWMVYYKRANWEGNKVTMGEEYGKCAIEWLAEGRG
jgi:hypothetical protein